MKACQGLILALVVSLPILTAPAFAEISPASKELGNSPGGREAQWVYDSPLCVVESITDIGGGQYEYSYSFLNVDDAHIWHFGVWVTFSLVTTTATWVEHPQWSHGALSMSEVAPEYDGRNLDPNITYVAATWGPNWPNTTDPINPGDYVSGFSYVTNVSDPSPKYYFYETVELGWAQDTGYLAAVGMTSTGPSAAETNTWGNIKSLYRGN